ncbi:hypothetical protein [Parabacteroides sp. FAFU027]|uniref:hypothetical protein n=1 Tax=Parabacteroides sp. FAFU027 TaxID=2922715 RepID=UPI001FAEC477|nr:hypothetical protein [Parabacteroides sp. FAFU027]
MKKLTLLILITFIATTVMAQKKSIDDDAIYQSSSKTTETQQTNTTVQNSTITPGDYLKKAANARLTSTLTQIAGGFIIGLSPTIDDKDTRSIITIGGLAFGIVSLITHFTGISYEHKAGEALNRERNNDKQVYIQPAKEGLGVNITF